MDLLAVQQFLLSNMQSEVAPDVHLLGICKGARQEPPWLDRDRNAEAREMQTVS